MEETMNVKGSSMIHPRPGPIGLNSINTIETKARMETQTERMRAIRTEESKDLNLQQRTREEERRAENPNLKKVSEHSETGSIPAIALQLIKDLEINPLHNKDDVYKVGTIDAVPVGAIDYIA
jgi:hypothetical protein